MGKLGCGGNVNGRGWMGLEGRIKKEQSALIRLGFHGGGRETRQMGDERND